MGYSPVVVSNNILRRAFDEKANVTPMKLQKILFFAACEYAKRTGRQLLDGSFQAWKYGPVNRTVYDEFRSFGGDPIRSFGKDAKNKAYKVNEDSDPNLKAVLDAVWAGSKQMSAVALSRLTHEDGSAWAQVFKPDASAHIGHEIMLADRTYQKTLGVSEGTAL
ncbi:hypothetical protein GCM10010910_01560 [Microbacterium nanhaiense]|uniref:Antitoxin SocA-like Panacea domain-containing protein n=2 Tax=Microbacterium nanhaiense TaxID=1301026 RepID=A0ABQ2MV17_9MICO|nr:hypothetical protein GCM10010910_01560 [Microbacterium nanhaiense]